MAATRLFVSHSSQDNDWCRPFFAALTSADPSLDVWYDEHGLSGGSAWVQTLQQELQARDVVVLVLTPDSLASQWVQEEMQLALATRRTILPVMHKPSNLSGFLLTRQWVDVVDLSPEDAARKVLTALNSPVVFPEAVAPKQIVPAPEIVPQPFGQMGYVGRIIDGVQVITPPLCDVPAGPFLRGSDPKRDPEATDAEIPMRTVDLPAFKIGRYPVTVVEYACAIRAGAMREPRDWATVSQRPYHPITNVSWRDAINYSAWLTKVTGEHWRPPTEDEWEKAARGTDGRIYPWGDQFDSRRANTEEGGPGEPTAVGMYPMGVSPYGALDMAGNVQEWCGLTPDSPLLRPNAMGEPGKSVGYLAGGSFSDSPTTARCAYRAQLFMGERGDETGMRLVLQLS
ncbi:MAG TPA: SUMF1/EgtB/PvdO family nonheme iron enzyme [Ktedonobacterales bacterium]|jgi:formylglycine-generating enzyme required for sulfatase activity